METFFVNLLACGKEVLSVSWAQSVLGVAEQTKAGVRYVCDCTEDAPAVSHRLSVRGEGDLGINCHGSSLPENESPAHECIFFC